MTPTLYEWAGGTDAFRRLIDAFYDRVERDEILAPMSEEHRAHVTLLALHNSGPDAEVVELAPVPRWGWGVAPPYLPGG